MFHRMKSLKYLCTIYGDEAAGYWIEVEFENGIIKQYNIENLFSQYPQFKALKDKDLFINGKLEKYGIIWTDELDLSGEEIYYNGITKHEIIL